MSNKTVLVVEDNDDIRELAVEVLESDGYSVLAAEHGRRALELLAELPDDEPCLILLDLMMPVMGGKEFLEEVHRAHPVASLPVVVVSASLTEALPGVRRYVKKPVSPDALRQIVREACGLVESSATQSRHVPRGNRPKRKMRPSHPRPR